ncbi:TIGR03067 domain-containing protein [Novipirellula artificiosorum]|uniref:TIGR03067 domain-containing protein n=1 Tax=Novipirellula artificiosorum TaxID=2528016 RepID=A0A5C6DWS2_9BACT|nr:TIGR03067 domain-containing protein [Novipirellula artificiosorum]TWU41082.1 hypothetical protein Poly41_19190 [Novipirellula artificiosorum]
MQLRVLTTLLAWLTCVPMAFAANGDLQRLQGKWKVTQLTEDGRVIPVDAIQLWLPSGGEVEIKANAIVFESPVDKKQYAKSFSLANPNFISIISPDQTAGEGIYQFDSSGNQVAMCVTDPRVAPRPTDFSSPPGSKRMMLVLQRQAASAIPPGAFAKPIPLPPPPSGITSSPGTNPNTPAIAAGSLTDAQVAQMLSGTWALRDAMGTLAVTYHPNGAYTAYRQHEQIAMFQQMFAQPPASTGTWSVQNGLLTMKIASSVQPQTINQTIVFAVRTISAKDLVLLDQLGRVVTSARVK